MIRFSNVLSSPDIEFLVLAMNLIIQVAVHQ